MECLILATYKILDFFYLSVNCIVSSGLLRSPYQKSPLKDNLFYRSLPPNIPGGLEFGLLITQSGMRFRFIVVKTVVCILLKIKSDNLLSHAPKLPQANHNLATVTKQGQPDSFRTQLTCWSIVHMVCAIRTAGNISTLPKT